MNWTRGFSALYELKKVDPVTWMDMGSFEFTGGSISLTDDNLQESAAIQMTTDPGECWLRVYLNAKQEGGGARIALFTGLASTPQRDLDGTRESFQATCYSVLKPADDVLVPLGYYVPAGADGAQIAAQLLSVGPAPVTCEDNSPRLLEPIVAEETDSNLSIAQQIVETIGWRIRIRGDGSISIEPAAENVSLKLDPQENDSVELKITDAQDWYSVPNCYRVSTGNLYAIARDDAPDSPLSTVSRKAARGGTGEIWASESGVSLSDGESLAEYAARKLKEAQAAARNITYTRRFFPDVLVGDLVGLHYPGVGIDGIFRVSRQTITLGYGAKIQEEVVKE